MSELITNLQTIYNTKLAIKQAIGTDSDNFVDYPSYISGMVSPSGTSYITTNGDYDIASYAYVNVDVQGGGGVQYTWIDWTTSPVLTQGDKVSFNGYLGSGEQITQEIINVYPGFADYLGWYLYPVGGWDRTTTGTTPWEKYVLSENQLSISQNSGVVVSGEILDITMGSATQKITILEDINETKFAGGNGTKSITTNGTENVVGYKSVSVNVTPQRNHDGLTEITAFTVDEALDFINTLDPNTPTSNMYYVKGRISQVIYTIDSTYNTWRGYISNDGTTETNELLVYGNGYGPEYQTVNWDENVNPQVKVGDSVVVYAKFQLYNNTPQTKNGYLANHQRAVNGSPVNPITANGVVDVQDYVSVTVNIPQPSVSLPETCLVAIGDQGTTQIIEPDQNTGDCVLSIPIDFTAGSNVALAENYSVFLIDHDLIMPFYPSNDTDMSDWGNLASLGLVDGSELTVTYPQGRAFNPNSFVANFGIRPIYLGESDCPITVTNELAEYYNDGNDYVFTFTVEMNNNNIWGVNILQAE